MSKEKSKKFYIGAVIIVLILIAAILRIVIPQLSKPKDYTNSSIAMGTVINQTIYAKDESSANSAISGVMKVINSLDQKNLSWRLKGSDVYNINENGSYKVSNTTANCISTCLGISKDCGGLFDITVGDLTTLWNIGTEDARVPSKEEISNVLDKIDYSQVTVNDNAITIGKGQKLDLGAVGKGLACDEVRSYLKSTNVNSAVVSVGGSILLYGENPTTKDGSWNVGIRDPFGNADDFAAVLNCGQVCVSTSGDYEKVLVADGVKYHHILNPKTGYPSENNITGVTIVSNSGVVTDGLSTACFILGYSNDSLALLKKYDSQAIFITKDKKVYITDGLKGKVKLTNDKYSFAN